MNRRPRLRTDLLAAPIEDQVLVVDGVSHRSHLLSPLAWFVAQACDGSRRPSELTGLVAGEAGTSPAGTATAVAAVLEELRSASLVTVEPPADAATGPTRSPSLIGVAPRGRADRGPTLPQTRAYRMAAWQFRVVGPRDFVGAARAVLGVCDRPAPSLPVHRYVVRPGRCGLRVSIDGCPVSHAMTAGDALAWMLWHANHQAANSVSDGCVMHAAVVAIGAGCVLMPAISGSGKSTLAAAMSGRGHPCLSDELAVVSRRPGGIRVRGVRRAIALEPSSRELFGETAVLLEADDPVAGHGAWYRDPGPRLGGGARRLTAVVMPSYRPGSSLSWRTVGPARAALDLTRHAVQLTQAGLESLVEVATTVPALELVHGDAHAAAQAIEDDHQEWCSAAQADSVPVGSVEARRP